MNFSLELHDSIISKVEATSESLVLTVDPAYIHESPGTPGTDAGIGYWQTCTISLQQPITGDTARMLGLHIFDGVLQTEAGTLTNLIPLPHVPSTPVSITLCPQHSMSAITIGASSCTIAKHGAKRGIEQFVKSAPTVL